MKRPFLRGGLVLAALLCLQACGDKVDRSAPLAFAPADTPWLFANLEPVPESVRARFENQVQAAWPVMFEMFDQSLADLRTLSAEAPASADTGTLLRLFEGVLDELRARDTPAKWREIGFGTDARMALYGIDLLPVMRVELADPAAFRALVKRLEQKVGQPLATLRIDEQDAWTFGGETAGGLMAIHGSHLVLAVVPGSADEALKRRVLGLDQPAKSIADDAAFPTFNAQRGYLPYGSGWVDTRRIVALAASEGHGWAIARAKDSAPAALDATCRAEFDSIAAKAPRLAFGYTAFEADRMAMHARIDLDPALATSLMSLGASTPGAASRDALFDFGIALPILGMRDFLAAQADAVAKAPYKCEHLAALNTGFAELKPKLEGMLPPPVANLSGLRLTATRLDWPQGATMPDFGGTLLVGSDSPALLAGLAQLASPELQKIVLTPDGKPIAVPASALPPGFADVPVSVAMGGKALAVAVGQDDTARLAAAVTAAPAGAGTWLDMSFDGRMYGLFGDAIDRFGAFLPDADRKGLDAQRKLYAMYAKWFRRLDARVAIVAEGIDMTETVEFVAR